MRQFRKQSTELLSMKVETTLPLQKEARILQFTMYAALSHFPIFRDFCLFWRR